MSKIVLSIGMIVKNESTHLRNCLNALKPLMKAVKSELIIADTGSTDDTVQIAREFTNNVIKIKWNDNFAEARNYTIRAAKGEWYMFIDADEYLEDADELIKFFNSGIYRYAEAASYFIRNYISDEVYSETTNTRLCKITPDIKFSGRVHETLPGHLTATLINSYVRHHGYYSSVDTDLFNRKMMRNLPILLKRYEEEPTELLTIRHLFYTYNELGERARAKEYLDKGVEIVKNDVDGLNFPGVYHALVDYFSDDSSPESQKKVVEVADEYFKLRPNPSIGAIKLLISQATSYCVLGDYKAALVSLKRAYELQQMYLVDKLDIGEIGTISSSGISALAMNTVKEKLAGCYIMLKEYDNAFYWLDQSPLVGIEDVNKYRTVIVDSNQPQRFGDLFKRIVGLGDSADKTALMDSLIEHFNIIVLTFESAAKIIQPFYDLYHEAMISHVLRKQLANDTSDEALKKLPTAYQIVYHLDMAEKLKQQKNDSAAMKHIKTAMRIDSRFVPIITSRMRGKSS